MIGERKPKEPPQTEVDEAEMWASVIRGAQIEAITHGVSFIRMTHHEDHTLHVEILQPHDYMPWGLTNTMETKQ